MEQQSITTWLYSEMTPGQHGQAHWNSWPETIYWDIHFPQRISQEPQCLGFDRWNSVPEVKDISGNWSLAQTYHCSSWHCRWNKNRELPEGPCQIPLLQGLSPFKNRIFDGEYWYFGLFHLLALSRTCPSDIWFSTCQTAIRWFLTITDGSWVLT